MSPAERLEIERGVYTKMLTDAAGVLEAAGWRMLACTLRFVAEKSPTLDATSAAWNAAHAAVKDAAALRMPGAAALSWAMLEARYPGITPPDVVRS